MQKSSRARTLLCALLSIALLLSISLGALAAQDTPAAQIIPQSITLTDQGGRQVTLSGPVERVVSGYYISTSACIALGLQDKLVGVEAKAAGRPIYALAAPELLDLPNVGTAKEFNLEGCIALEPDLVLLPLRLRDSAETLAQLGIPVLLVNPESHQELVDMITLIGEAAGVQERAAELIGSYREQLDDVAALVQGITEKPRVYMAGNSAYLTTAPGDMYQATLMEAAGGINAAGSIDGDSWTEVSYEQVAAMDPEVIVIPAEASYSREELLADPQLAGLAAVREGRVYQMPTAFEAWDSPVPSGILGVKWMLYALHEDLYSLEALQEDAAAFYLCFYGAEIDPALIHK